MTFLALLAIALSLSLATFFYRRQSALRRAEFIRAFTPPKGLFERVKKRRPDLTRKDFELVTHGLKQFFIAHLKSGRKFVSMPSQVVDDVWHEFILYTKNYEKFCRNAFGRFLHHTPAVVLSANRDTNAGLRRVWWYACLDEGINPRSPTRLPLLFALDAKLNLADGFRYVADCKGVKREGDGSGAAPYCGGEFSDGSHDFGNDGVGDLGMGAGDAGGDTDGGGDGGCGGGCGGGD